MGNLFSSTEDPPARSQRSYESNTLSSAAWHEAPYQQIQLELYQQRQLELYQQRQRELQEQQSIERQFQRLTIGQIRQITKPKPIIYNAMLVKEFLKAVDADNEYIYPEVYKLNPIYSYEYHKVKALFESSNKKCFSVVKIEKVNNPYIFLQYMLNKIKYEKKFGHVNQMELFHGTKQCNIKSICRTNFNWRLKGTSRGHIFGQGVSFSPISNYATHYGDASHEKVMVLANVLVSNHCVGTKETILPPDNFDTTTKENNQVYVKYEDNTFYPAYIVHYTGDDPTKNIKRNGRNTRRRMRELNIFYD